MVINNEQLNGTTTTNNGNGQSTNQSNVQIINKNVTTARTWWKSERGGKSGWHVAAGRVGSPSRCRCVQCVIRPKCEVGILGGYRPEQQCNVGERNERIEWKRNRNNQQVTERGQPGPRERVSATVQRKSVARNVNVGVNWPTGNVREQRKSINEQRGTKSVWRRPGTWEINVGS